MNSRNLWGPLPATEQIITPTLILREQATQLSNMTNGILRGEVSVSSAGSTFVVSLAVVAPFVDNYTYLAVQVEHELELYPVTVRPGYDLYSSKVAVECTNQSEFEKAVGEILSSEHMQRIIRSLLAQSRSM
jgi:hypothetical protein